MSEVEDEFAFQDENKRTKPRLLVQPIEGVERETTAAAAGAGTMVFLKAFVVEKTKLQPVATKVDSILLKGSKVLANHPKSNYVEGTLFLMAKSYFFRQEWVASQQKCLEAVEKFPDGDYSPDVHLLLAKDYLLQRKISQGKQALSKAIDVAWYKDRYDILSEAFRIQAEIELEQGDVEKAVQPYKQAIAQSEDDIQRAKWQVDLASVYYGLGNWKMAEEQFSKVHEYTPDPLAQFEATLYRGAALARLQRFDEADALFLTLEKSRNFDEWASFIAAERISLDRQRTTDKNDPALIAQEKKADTSFVGRPELMAQAFQKAMGLYKQAKYEEALKYFAKAKVVRTPVYDVANKYFTLIKQWEDQHHKIAGLRAVIPERPIIADSIKRQRSREFYTLARVHEQMGNLDSALTYYAFAHDSTTADDEDRGRYLYAQARLLRVSNPDEADRLLTIITEKYPKTEVAREAFSSLGFTQDAQIDDAAELYRSGNSFRKVKDYNYASRQYLAIVANHGTSDIAPKALYALGWMFERDVVNNDSALFYYEQLVEKYPRSVYAKEVRPSVEYALAKRNGVEVADSLLLRDLDDDLYKRGKAGELDAIQQLLKNNQDALQMNAPGLNNVPGLNLPTLPGVNGGKLPGQMPGQMPNGRPPDSTAIPPTVVAPKP